MHVAPDRIGNGMHPLPSVSQVVGHDDAVADALVVEGDGVHRIVANGIGVVRHFDRETKGCAEFLEHHVGCGRATLPRQFLVTRTGHAALDFADRDVEPGLEVPVAPRLHIFNGPFPAIAGAHIGGVLVVHAADGPAVWVPGLALRPRNGVFAAPHLGAISSCARVGPHQA